MSEDFAAAPKVVKPKNKYKQEPQEQEEDQIKLIYNNLMWDKRVFRGNTYSAIVISKKNQLPYQTKSRMPMMTHKQPQETTNSFENNKRTNIEIFTDQFVETLTDKPPKYEYASQTEPLPQKIILRHRMNEKTGTDIETQIEDNQLFDFDYEVEPLLNVLCGRTLQLSRMQVLQQQELKIMSNRQQQLKLYERQQNKKIQNMYSAEDQLEQQNMKMLENFKKKKDQKIKTHKKIFSRVLAKHYLKNIKNNTLNYVQGNGFFRNPIEYRLSTELIPKIYVQTSAIAAEDSKYATQAIKILEAAKQDIVKQHAFAKQAERTRRKVITDKREERAKEKKERKGMQEEEKYTRKFLALEKIELEKQEAKKAEQNEKQQGQEP